MKEKIHCEECECWIWSRNTYKPGNIIIKEGYCHLGPTPIKKELTNFCYSGIPKKKLLKEDGSQK